MCNTKKNINSEIFLLCILIALAAVVWLSLTDKGQEAQQPTPCVEVVS